MVMLHASLMIPYFPPFDDGIYQSIGQWHLDNQTGSEALYGIKIDANLVPAWNAGWTGAGVMIGIVDDGLQWNHADIIDPYDAADSYDFQFDVNDPYPFYPNQFDDSAGFPIVTVNDDNHGTSVAG
jgi:subtilisin family serine protease